MKVKAQFLDAISSVLLPMHVLWSHVVVSLRMGDGDQNIHQTLTFAGSVQAHPTVPQGGAVRRRTDQHQLHYALLQPQEEDRLVHRPS